MRQMFERTDSPFNRLTLRFASPTLEKQFAAWINRSRSLRMRLAMLLVSALYGILALLDAYFSPADVVERARGFHLLVMIPMLLLSVLMGSVRATEKYFVPAAAVTTGVAAVCNLFLVHLLGLQSFYVPELYFMILWVFAVAGFRLWPATALAAAIVGAAVLNALTIPGAAAHELYNYFFWLFVSFSLAYLGGHLLEYYSKVYFYNARQLRNEIEERKVAQEQLRHTAFHDPLTGLPNRMLLSDRLANAILRAERAGEKVGWIYVDLDRFKQLNDTFGHAAGDKLLTMVARRLRACVRASDTVGRLGGDEFTILLDGIVGTEDAMRVAEKIRASLEVPYDLGAAPSFSSSASIGVAIFPDHGRDETVLSKRADAAMYRSKRKGRNAVTMYGA